MLTPLDIHNKVFKRSIRGYNMEEVDAFLDEIIRDHEILIRENQSLQETIARLEDEVTRGRETGEALEKTMVLAQRIYEEESVRAKKEADFLIIEAESRGERIVEDAQKALLETRQRIEHLRLYEKQLYLKHKGFLEFQMELLDGYHEKEAVFTDSEMDLLTHGARERDLLGEEGRDQFTLPDVVSAEGYETASGMGAAEGAGLSGTAGVAGAGEVADAGGAVASGTAEVGGAAGTSGIAGAAEAAGVSGTAGVGGVAGVSGTAEVGGAAGTSGIAGTAGAADAAGVSGTAGVGGVAGVSGTADAAGAVGTAGVSGTAEVGGAGGIAETGGVAGTAGASEVAGASGASGVGGVAGASEIAETDGQASVFGEGSPFILDDEPKSEEEVRLLADNMEEALKTLDAIYGPDDNDA